MKFKTVIKHKQGSQIEIGEHVFSLEPDADGFCTIDTEDENVIARLKSIPEGFTPIDDSPQKQAATLYVVVDDKGKELDLSAMTKAELVAFARAENIAIDKDQKKEVLLDIVYNELTKG